MFNLIILNLIVGTSSYLICEYFFAFKEPIDNLLAWAIFFFSQIILCELILGLMGKLDLGSIFLFQTSGLLLMLFLTRGKKERLHLISEALNQLGKIKLNKIQVFCLAAVCGFALTKLAINLINPPFGWDSLNYHFTFPVEWLKHGNLDNPIVISDDPAPSYYPINGSLIFFWWMLPLKNFFIADLAQLPFFILALLAVFNISKKIGLSGEHSFYSAVLFGVMPNFFKQLEIAYVDIMVAALFLISLNFIFNLAKEFSWKNIFLSAVSCGLMLGTKSLALFYCLLLFIPVFFLFSKDLSKALVRKRFLQAGVFLATVILLGGFSYMRNFFLTGNPFYPLDAEIFGKIIFKGAVGRASYAAHFLSQDYALTKFLFHEGLGLQTILFVLPAVILALPVYLYLSRKRLDFLKIYFFLLPFILYVIFRYLIPLGNVRYIYNLLALGLIGGFYIYQKFNVPAKAIKAVMTICLLASISELAGHQELIWSLILSAAAFMLFLSPSFVKRIAGILVLLILLPALFLLNADYTRNEYSRYVKNSPFWPDATQAWFWLNNNTKGSNISYVGRPVPLPLYGTGFKNNVFYSSVNAVDPVRLHYFKNARLKWDYAFEQTHRNLEEPGNYRADAKESDWIENLKKHKAGYLFVYSLHQTKSIEFPIEDFWASSRIEIFQPVFANSTIHIYKIKI